MKKIVLKVVKQCVSTEGVRVSYIREELVPGFFTSFWIRRNAVDKKNYKQLIETTVEIAGRVGGAEIITKIVDELKDENEGYRRIVLETIERIVSLYGVDDVDGNLEQRLLEGVLYAFQEQTSDETDVILNAFGTIVNSLGVRVKSHIP
jgi:splicing factor 3B subunit 1